MILPVSGTGVSSEESSRGLGRLGGSRLETARLMAWVGKGFEREASNWWRVEYCSRYDFLAMEVRFVSHRRPREKSLRWTTIVHESPRIVMRTCLDHRPFQMSRTSSVSSQRWVFTKAKWVGSIGV